jgi:hypothetical protein
MFLCVEAVDVAVRGTYENHLVSVEKCYSNSKGIRV